MAEAYKALPLVMGHEGGFSDDPADRGGTTNFGVSLRFLREAGIDVDGDGDIDAADVRQITREEAGKIFIAHFWRFDCVKEQAVANKLFDIAVNMGLQAAVKLCQRTLNGMSWKMDIDGEFGALTCNAINASDPDAFLKELRALQAMRYAEIAVNNPTQKKFLHGWMRRAMA